MKIVVIGCTHAGTSAILNILKKHKEAQITVYERNDTISFLSCGIALYVGGVVKNQQDLFYCSPEILAEKGVRTKMTHDVLSIDAEKKTLQIKNKKTQESFSDSYDKLIITTGSWPITPKIPGIDLENILLSKSFYHSTDIVEKSKKAKNIVVVGAGYIGVELAEAFSENGKNVTLIDGMDKILNKYLDGEFSNMARESLEEHDIQVALGRSVEKFEGEKGRVTQVVTNKGVYPADLVIMCVGFRPNTEIFKDKLEMLPNGAILVDEYMRTSAKDVFAAGDCCSVLFNPTGKQMYIPLATNAIRMGALVAENIQETKVKYIGTQGTSGIKIFDQHIAATGLTEEVANALNMDVSTVVIDEEYRPTFMPSHENIRLKIVYLRESRVILGAQLISKVDLTQSINTLSVCIQNKMTIDQLAYIDFFFQPHYSKPWSFMNLAGLRAQ